MYELHCPNCGWTSQMTDEAQAAAVAEADQLGATYHIEACPRCQWVMRVPVAELRAVPVEASPEMPVLLPAPETPLLLEAEKPAPKKKAPARKPAARKVTTKKKPAAKKAGTKKPISKKPVAKKAAAKKPAARKSTTKKPAVKRKK